MLAAIFASNICFNFLVKDLSSFFTLLYRLRSQFTLLLVYFCQSLFLRSFLRIASGVMYIFLVFFLLFYSGMQPSLADISIVQNLM